ncbi:MAG: hypothetical protein RLY59_1178, partial [Actinomycetota bacterium]|jgi:2-C-methyl-D-erythritol 4-phosphate cytidylyltransferase/2-C-methyl-D-erythritol 2,4-cyclodiphosphate synthase
MSGDLHVSTAVIVVAAGSGTRLGAALPKAFVDLAGQTLLERSLRSIILLPYPVQVVVVAPADFIEDAHAILHKVAPGLESLVSVVTGGATRHDSVAAGLAVVDSGVQVVLVHDAARALTPTSVFADVDMAVQATGAGVIPALPVVDSLKQVDVTGGILGIADREQLRIAQTPQGFPRAELDAAYAAAGSADFTDDASVFAANGGVMTTIPGDEVAFKITTAWDLNRAHQVLGGIPDRHRVGTGIDVHAFGEKENLWLAGLHWPGEKELSGHSDGDAVAHAICDALLSAAGLGDIGSRFGTDDPAYANASGEVFIRGTVALLEENGFDPINVSVQIVGNKPRFSPRREEAQNVLSSWVGAPVTVSATTTDGLGFTGRGEGIAAIATALVRQR